MCKRFWLFEIDSKESDTASSSLHKANLDSLHASYRVRGQKMIIVLINFYSFVLHLVKKYNSLFFFLPYILKVAFTRKRCESVTRLRRSTKS